MLVSERLRHVRPDSTPCHYKGELMMFKAEEDGVTEELQN